MPFPPIKTISYPPRSNHPPLEGGSELRSRSGEGSEKQITTSILHNNSLTPHEASKLASAPPINNFLGGSDADRPRFNHSPLEGESKLQSNFGGGSENYITTSILHNNSLTPHEASKLASAPPINNFLGGSDADRELHRGDADRPRFNHSPLEGESKLQSNFGGGSKD